ncbi:hypothetical protein A0H81_12903 [Grifola frondosa]|uniref:Uncharacterized protein n=1 Tax=Grifola frondosa TaxID=5627 RepID=A0A1C7LRA7_GRIFR|nr:hypothetical protein A0H81_12903 [Grifola frondosa]
MLRSLTKLPLRRCLHTSSSRPASTARSSRFGALAGASAAATVYFAWKSFYGETIALDSASSSSKQVPLTPKASLSPDTISHSSSTAAQHEPSIHAEPTSHTNEDDSTPSTEPSEPSADAVGATEGEEEAAGGGGRSTL